jgi:hypothetical protein
MTKQEDLPLSFASLINNHIVNASRVTIMGNPRRRVTLCGFSPPQESFLRRSNLALVPTAKWRWWIRFDLLERIRSGSSRQTLSNAIAAALLAIMAEVFSSTRRKHPNRMRPKINPTAWRGPAALLPLLLMERLPVFALPLSWEAG